MMVTSGQKYISRWVCALDYAEAGSPSHVNHSGMKQLNSLQNYVIYIDDIKITIVFDAVIIHRETLPLSKKLKCTHMNKKYSWLFFIKG